MRTFYFHPTVTTQYRGKTVTRRATVAAILKPVNDGEKLESFHYGLSVCSEKDQFRKSYGRESALGKAWSKHPAIIVGTTTKMVEQKEFNKFFLENAITLLNLNGYLVLAKPTKTPKKQLA